MKIYQVCREYYDWPDSTIIKTFSSEKKAEIFIKEYKEPPKWKDNHDNNECMVINEYEVN